MGWHTLWATLLVILAALLIPAFGVLCTLICLQAIGLVVGLALRPAVSLYCDLPDRVIAGQEATVRLQVRNDSSRPAYDLVCGLESLPPDILAVDGLKPIGSLWPGQSMVWSCWLIPQRRGRHSLAGPVCRSTFPFNLLNIGRAMYDKQTLLVLPVVHDLDVRTLGPWVGLHSDSPRRLSSAGTYPEYLGNRPYQPGDPPRRIDARAWARLSVPVVREFQETGDPRVGLVLDTRLDQTGRHDSNQAFEAAVSLCGSIAHSLRRCCTIEWLATGPEVHPLTAVPQAERFDRIHEILAEVGPSQPHPTESPETDIAGRLATVSAVLFVLLFWDEDRRQWIEQTRQAGCHVLTLVVATQDTPREPDLDVHWVSPLQALEGQVRL
jgi:uncharacterized protein (DUF58 family)